MWTIFMNDIRHFMLLKKILNYANKAAIVWWNIYIINVAFLQVYQITLMMSSSNVNVLEKIYITLTKQLYISRYCTIWQRRISIISSYVYIIWQRRICIILHYHWSLPNCLNVLEKNFLCYIAKAIWNLQICWHCNLPWPITLMSSSNDMSKKCQRSQLRT